MSGAMISLLGHVQLGGAKIDDQILGASTVSGGAFVTFTVTNTGTYGYTSSNQGSFSFLGTWLLAGAAGDFEIYASVSGFGGSVSGATGSWLPLSTGRSWTLNVGMDEYANRVLNLQIRRTSGGAIVDSASISLEAGSGSGS